MAKGYRWCTSNLKSDNRELSEMLEAPKYLSIVQSRGERGLPLNRVYRGMRSPALFLMAYMNLHGNAGAMTNGVDPKDHIDGMSLGRIHNVVQTLKDGTFRWKPARRVYIPKTKGNHRPLGIPGWTDKLVQEVMRLVLSAYYEPRFSTHSHGFRPNRSCHTALGEIVRTWKGVKWLIEGDIEGCFDNINHELLISIIGRDIHDTRFIQLLKDLLNVGYLENWKFHQTFSGTPQGGVVSPLLANIYLNEFDQHVEQTLIPQWTKGEAKKRKPNPEYASLNARYHYLRMKGNLTEEEVQRMRELKKVRNTLSVYDPQDPKFRRLRYVRYADDCVPRTRKEGSM
jgi:group II intron reverse transcriptase/maturase